MIEQNDALCCDYYKKYIMMIVGDNTGSYNMFECML